MPRTQKNLSFSQLRVGIFVLAALLILGFLIINSTGEFNPFEKKLHLRARFLTADGLREGAEVQLAGVTIGKVDAVTFLPPGSPEAEKIEAMLTIAAELDGKPINERIRTDSTAQLIAMSLLANDKMINITPGTSNASPVSENHVLNSTTTMSINQLTQTGNDLLQQINKLSVPANEILEKANRGEGTLGRVVNDDSLYRNLDTAVAETRLTVVKLQTTLDKVNRGDGSAGKLLNDPELYNSLNRTVGQLESISRDLRSGRGSAGKFLTDDALYNDTRAAVNDLRGSIQELKPTFERLNKIAGDIDLITADLSQGKGSAGRFLKDEQLYEEARNSIARFNSTAAKFDLLLGDVQSGKGTIGKLLTDETLYNNANQTAANINQLSSEGTKLIYDFRQNPKKYLRIKFSIF
ncbi:MAG: Resistance to organic solvent transporter periplasmic protein [Acidobacteria bacterium]|jgi:phospholipid/cholesterol/gamma-HCH transport system substrate-binding protein|nr:Resistance to organic solvent transporter periplasmic protein [Acidobacteriota bacterium]